MYEDGLSHITTCSFSIFANRPLTITLWRNQSVMEEGTAYTQKLSPNLHTSQTTNLTTVVLSWYAYHVDFVSVKLRRIQPTGQLEAPSTELGSITQMSVTATSRIFGDGRLFVLPTTVLGCGECGSYPTRKLTDES